MSERTDPMPDGPQADFDELDVDAMLRDISLVPDYGPDPFKPGEVGKASPRQTIRHLMLLSAAAAWVVAILMGYVEIPFILSGPAIFGVLAWITRPKARPVKRPRISIGRLLIASTLIGLAVGSVGSMEWRAQRFRAQHLRHRQRAAAPNVTGRRGGQPPSLESPEEARESYHLDMSMKYFQASRSPWFPVAPDPPEPE